MPSATAGNGKRHPVAARNDPRTGDVVGADVDYSIAFLAKRELAHAAQAAANDAASALAEARFHANHEVTIDPVRAAVRARAAIERRDSRWIRLGDPEVLVVGDRVIVRLAGAVSTIFSKGVPGGPSEIGVSVEARAQARVR